jgi:hypothetical protein
MRWRFTSRCPNSAAPSVTPGFAEQICLEALDIEGQPRPSGELKVSSLKSNEASLTYNAAKAAA